MADEAKHVHSFDIDMSCDCGVMLSDYTRSLKKIAGEMHEALKNLHELADYYAAPNTALLNLSLNNARAILARYEKEFQS